MHRCCSAQNHFELIFGMNLVHQVHVQDEDNTWCQPCPVLSTMLKLQKLSMECLLTLPTLRQLHAGPLKPLLLHQH